MNSKTRKRIWPVALMPLAILGVVAVVVALSAMGPQTTQAQTSVDCSSLPDAINAARCNTCQNEGGVWNTNTDMCEMPSGNGGGGNGGGSGGGSIGGGGNEGSANPSDVDVEAPGMVQNLTVKAYDDGIEQQELEVTWEAPTDGGFVESYRVDISGDGERWFSYITDHGSNDLRWVHRGLKAEQTRYFRVFAFSHDDDTTVYGPGSEASGTTAASWVPERPEDLTADMHDVNSADFAIDMNGDGDAVDTAVRPVREIDHLIDFNEDGDFDDIVTEDETNGGQGWPGSTQTTIRLSWEPSENPPGAPVTSYEIEFSDNGLRWYPLADSIPPNPQPNGLVYYYDVGLRAGTERQYRVYARNSVGRSMVSDGDTGKTADSRAPWAVTDPVIGLSPAATDVHLKWTPPDDPPGDPVSHYRVQARAADQTPEADWERPACRAAHRPD